jgi:hexosaminidase
MKELIKVLVTFTFLVTVSSCKEGLRSQNQESVKSHGIIPLPLQADFEPGNFTFDSTVVIVAESRFGRAVEVTSEALKQCLLGRLELNGDSAGRSMIIFTKDSSLKEEGYAIQISGKTVTLTASTEQGAFYGAQTLKQMIWTETSGIKSKAFNLRNIDIKDYPRYSWRGFHIDLSRHLFTIEYLKKVIDELAYYKINKLHLHLTDDQGWRIEIKQFPLLTSVGAWRVFNNYDSACIAKSATDSKYDIDNRFVTTADGITLYGGYFSQQDMTDIVNYAADNFIEVIPEIDMPGHMTAAINAYPYLSCSGSPGWGKEFSYPVCPCDPVVMEFCHKVYDEIAELFPSTYIHLGSDEVNKDMWMESTVCENFMISNHLSGVNAIQSWFVTDMQKYLEAKGKTVIVWDDVIDGTADKNLVMMYWRDWVKDSPARCAANGNNIILTPWSPFYISNDHTDKTLQDLYNYDPEKVLPSAVTDKVIGIQSCLWTEEIPSESMFEYLVYPRMQALAEVAWGSGKDWTTFMIRLESHLQYMKSKNIHYKKPSWAD